MEHVEEFKEIVVGCAFMTKKVSTMKGTLEAFKNGRPTVVLKLIDLDIISSGGRLEDQGPFDVIIHKLTEDIYHIGTSAEVGKDGDGCVIFAAEEREQALMRLKALGDYCLAHPHIPLLDDPLSVARVVSRVRTCELLATISGESVGAESRVECPRFIVAPFGVTRLTTAAIERTLAESGIPLCPLICKPVVACGPGSSHLLTLFLEVPSRALSDGEGPPQLTAPTVVQEYVNHDGVLLKVYVIGDQVRLFERPSLPNIPTQGQLQTFFDAAPKSNPAGVPEWQAGVVLFDSQKPYPTLGGLVGWDTSAAAKAAAKTAAKTALRGELLLGAVHDTARKVSPSRLVFLQ
jgi:hypothetical protein